MGRFHNLTVIVTGASAGVGAATARLFAAEGANLVLAARNKKQLQALAKELPGKPLVVPTDVAQLQDCRALIDAAVDHFGGIDILVNNAGCNHRGDVEAVSVEAMDQIIDVNLKAPLRLSRLALPYLRQSKRPAIVNVASLAGRFPLDGEATYSATKFGLRAFTYAMGEELRESGIRVCVVSPGPIETGFILDDIDEVPPLVFSQPMSSAEDIAHAIADCAEDGRRERAVPFASGKLATFGYLFPELRRVLKPVLEAQGRRAKRKFAAKLQK